MRLKPSTLAITLFPLLLLAYFHFQYGLFTRYNYFTAQWDKRHNDIHLINWGKGLLTNKEHEIIAHQMGFQWTTIAGCFIDGPSANGAEQYNKVITEYLDQKMGKKWRSKFDRSIDSLFRLQSEPRIRKAVLDDNGVKELINTYDPQKV